MRTFKNTSKKFITKENLEYRLFHLPTAFCFMIILMLLYGVLADHYYSWNNISNIFNQAAPLLVLACGQTLIVLMQGTDLSVGAMVNVIGVLWFTWLNLGLPLWLSVLFCLMAGAVFGFLNGAIAAFPGLPVFIVTLGTQNIFRSAALLISGDKTLYSSVHSFRFMVNNGFLGLSWSVWIGLLCFLLTWVILRKTTFGAKVTGAGGNPETLLLSGASIKRTKILAFMYAGFMAAVGALLLCCRIESGNPNAGNGLEFNSIAAVLLGGTSLREGKGGVEGTIFGVLLFQILKSGLTQIGISSIYQNAILGATVLAAIILDDLIQTRRSIRG